MQQENNETEEQRKAHRRRELYKLQKSSKV
jgi:hypothetical protein